MNDSAFRACAVIPSFNHWQALPAIVGRLVGQGLAIFIVDDGSAQPAEAALAALADPSRGVRVSRLAANSGKGAAVLAGFAAARAASFTHAIQIDADGQHDLEAVPPMLALARQHPDAIVAGRAVYDRSAPIGRVAGRWITHVCVWIETLSFDIGDSMCGLRVYPLVAVASLVARGTPIGERMDFDTDILVRLHRAGAPVVNHPVRVVYPAGNLSNFAMWRDNAHISAMHARLILGLPFALPSMLRHRPRRIGPSTHWSRQAERGLYWGLRLCALIYRLLGRRGCMTLLSVGVFYFYLTAGERRRASLDFLARAFAAQGKPRQPTWRDGYRHFLSFAGRALDSFAGWIGRIPSGAVVLKEMSGLRLAEADRRGALFVVSHHGNVDVSRATLDPAIRRRVLVLMHTRHAENYNRLLREFNPEAAVNMLQVTEMGPDTAIALQQRIDAGDWLFIAGDRTPVGSLLRTSTAPFLGADAQFPQGPYLLASLLDCPVYTFFCRREGTGFGVYVERFAERVVLPRGKRSQALADYSASYAARLEKHVLDDPFQWYNFFDFWRPAALATNPS